MSAKEMVVGGGVGGERVQALLFFFFSVKGQGDGPLRDFFFLFVAP